MLRTLENILGYRLEAEDGEIGSVYDFFLEDSLWRVRYLVIETGNWLNRRRVLISPGALIGIDGEARELAVNLTRAQVESSPDMDTEQPVSRQQEILMSAHYGWPAYWAPEAMMVTAPVAVPIPLETVVQGDPHLRSFREIAAYAIVHGGETVANVRDLIIDDEDWCVRSIIASRGGWLDSRQIALSTDSIASISWANNTILTRLAADDLETLPSFDPEAPVNRVERTVCFDYNGKPVDRRDFDTE